MSSLYQVSDATLRKLLGNQCLSKVTLDKNAVSAATIKTTGTTTYMVDGIACTKAALAAQSFAVTHNAFGETVGGNNPAAYVQPAGTSVFYVVALNAAGTVAIVQGSYAGQAMGPYPGDPSKSPLGTGALPVEPDGYTAIGVVKVVTAGVTFTPNTTALDAAGITATYYDVGRLPASL